MYTVNYLYFFYALLATAVMYTGRLNAVDQVIGPLEAQQVTYDRNMNIMGATTLTHVKVPGLSIYGPFKAVDVQVLGNLTVLGPVDAQGLSADIADITGPFRGSNIEVRSLQLIGSMDVEKITVFGGCRITGPLIIHTGKLDRLEVNSQEVTLEDVDVVEIIFHKQDAALGPPRLILKGKTSVQRWINFESGNGELRIEGSQVKVFGTVEGAIPFEMPRPVAGL